MNIKKTYFDFMAKRPPNKTTIDDNKTSAVSKTGYGDDSPFRDPYLPSKKFTEMKEYRNRSIFRKYNFVPLIAVGIVAFAVFVLVFTFVWSLLVYLTQHDANNAILVPALIYLGGIVFASAIMSLLIKGGTVFPAAILALIACIASMLFAGKDALSFGGIVLKLLLSIIFAAVGFAAAKYYAHYKKNQPDKMADSLTFREFD